VPKRKWAPAFATDQVRGLRAHGKDEDAASNHPKALEHKRHPLRFREISVTTTRDSSRLLQIGDTFFIVID